MSTKYATDNFAVGVVVVSILGVVYLTLLFYIGLKSVPGWLDKTAMDVRKLKLLVGYFIFVFLGGMSGLALIASQVMKHNTVDMNLSILTLGELLMMPLVVYGGNAFLNDEW
jgi:hypothetical protein